jgi:hypothetical protein
MPCVGDCPWHRSRETRCRLTPRCADETGFFYRKLSWAAPAQVGSRLILVPGARIVIEDAQGRILLQHRSDYRIWGLLQAARSRVRAFIKRSCGRFQEETSLQVLNLRPYGFADDPAHETRTYTNGHQCQFFSMLFHSNTYRGEPRICDDESLALDWFSPFSLPEILPTMARSIVAFMRYRETGDFQLIWNAGTVRIPRRRTRGPWWSSLRSDHRRER